MCGITGIFAFNLVGKFHMINVTAATMALSKRGPDFHDVYTDQWVGLGHRRLSIIDTSSVAHQPMWDAGNRYCIIFNGEIFNYQDLRKDLELKGVKFKSNSDTEVLLNLYILEGESCINKLNGFFALCIYDKTEQTFFLARDRYGIKPLLYLFDEDKFLFASEMKAIIEYGLEKQINYHSLLTYLQLNYIPAPNTIFTHVKKLLPGHYLKVSSRKLEHQQYYQLPETINNQISYDASKSQLVELLEDSVKRRLVADVRVGTFLSGGIDSSVVTALASRHKKDLHTFSIGFKDEPFFDETGYAKLVSEKFNTEHTIFSLTNRDLFDHLYEVLDYLDEPFADSSALNVFILSKETRKHATVALSGDGADELFAGYNKHAAFYRTLHPGIKEKLVTQLDLLWNVLPQSRNNSIGNKIRQLKRFATGSKLPITERYWQWAGYASEKEAFQLLSENTKTQITPSIFEGEKNNLLHFLCKEATIHNVLLTDIELVLSNDMLTKVDMMSMANSLEVRVPFLDYRVVAFVNSLPDDYKINRSMKKRILQDAFRDILPAQLYNRPKKGFEVPLLKWLRTELKSLITEDLLSEKTITDQGIFNYSEINKLKQQLFSANPQDATARIWGLIVFQWWWKKYNK